MNSTEVEHWEDAIQTELTSLEENNTWDVVDKPQDVTVLHCKWVLKKKRTADGNIAKYKARLVICGNEDEQTIDDTLAPVVDFTIVRLIIAVGAQKKWVIHQTDYDNAFTNGNLSRRVFMYVPKQLQGATRGKV